MTESSRQLVDALTDLRDAHAAIEACTDPAFHRRLFELRQWQSTHVAAFHAERAAACNGTDLLDFLTRRFYLESEWAELTAQPVRMATAVGRLVTNDRPLVIAIELQAVADSLDTDVAEALLADRRLSADQPLGAISYLRAIRQVGRLQARRCQIAWLDELINEVAGYADSRAAWWGFKVASAPARAVGMGRIYDLLADGFAALRACQDMEPATRSVVAAQQARLERLLTPIQRPIA